jgi:regulatory protein
MTSRQGRKGGSRKRLPAQEQDLLEQMPAGAKIEDIVAHPRISGRYQVIAGGEPVALVSASLVSELSLSVGRVLDETLCRSLARESVALAAYDKGVALLAVRARGTVELQRRLQRNGYESAAVEQAIERLSEQGFLDDERLSRQVARVKLGSGNAGRRRVEQELLRIGVDREVARTAVAEVVEEEAIEEGESALALARRRAGTMRGLAPEVARRRLSGFLARRGFESADAAAAVNSVLAELGAEEGHDEASGDG